MSASNYSLKINRDLLDPGFESYRLSQDTIPIYKVDLDADVEELKLNEYTLEHVRAFGMYNHLHLDPWYEDSVLFVDGRGRVLSFTVILDTALGKPREVYCVAPDTSEHRDRVCASLSLTSATWATLSDGSGRLDLLRTGKRGDSCHTKWEPLFSQDMGAPFTLLHSVAHVQDNVHTLEVLLLRIQKDPEETKGSGFSVFLEWITVANTAQQGQEAKYEMKKRRLLKGKSVPEYAAVEPRGKGLMVASERPFVFTHVDGSPLEQPDPEPMQAENSESIYFWQQTSENITVHVRMPEGVTKEEVNFTLTPNHISIGVCGGSPLIILEGQLYADVQPETSAWILTSDKSLEVTLQKCVVGPTWPELVMGDQRGEHLVGEEQAALVHQRLAHLTSQDWLQNVNAEKDKLLNYNSAELEDCDVFPEAGFSITHFDESLRPSQVMNLGGSQYLFTVVGNPLEMPCLCLRYDVDAIVLQPHPEQDHNMWEHIATFNALGYVQASKQDKKFLSCPPNFSYAALCECICRTFIYRQPSPLETVLFNRKQGRQIEKVAKQHVASLDSARAILGFRATNERVYVLTCSSIFILKVNNS
ncbi:nudC domain-containing protein 1 isoform X1 [Takifugu flavidus]|uniref:nudC domain-containing protein 1 isoform X1 n=2 Tax=Takifugu flavidus TaxID=433684 RepID=UPI0025449472|nr:nudC domain-containing protein 1 isoform X1 [Takifugu flavidus]